MGSRCQLALLISAPGLARACIIGDSLPTSGPIRGPLSHNDSRTGIVSVGRARSGIRRMAFVDLKSVSRGSRERLYKGCHAERVAAFDYAPLGSLSSELRSPNGRASIRPFPRMEGMVLGFGTNSGTGCLRESLGKNRQKFLPRAHTRAKRFFISMLTLSPENIYSSR